MEGMPIILSGYAQMTDATSNWANGVQANLQDPARIKNPSNAPMWVDEIRFHTTGDSANGGEDGTGGLLQARIRLGDIPLTRDFVPVWLFDKQLNPLQSEPFSGTGASACPVNMFTWRLPKPLFVPPNKPLEISFYATNPAPGTIITSLTTRQINVAVVARTLDKSYATPKSISVPWVTAFLSTPRRRGVANYVENSKTVDLANPHSVPLTVQALNGRILCPGGGDAPAEPNSTNALRSVGTTSTLVRIASSTGSIIVRDDTPFYHLFTYGTRQWRVNAQMQPRGRYILTLTSNYRDLDNNTKQFQAQVALVGHREVRL